MAEVFSIILPGHWRAYVVETLEHVGGGITTEIAIEPLDD